MKEQTVSKAYARSIYEIAEEKNVNIADELTTLNTIINESNDLESLLFLDLFSYEEKSGVLNDIFAKLNVSSLLKNFVNFLLQEQRFGLFPLIFKEVIVMDDHKSGFIRGTIEGSEDSITEDVKNKIVDFLTGKVDGRPQLTYVKNESISAGYRVTVDDLQLDASLENQLSKFKETVLNQ